MVGGGGCKFQKTESKKNNVNFKEWNQTTHLIPTCTDHLQTTGLVIAERSCKFQRSESKKSLNFPEQNQTTHVIPTCTDHLQTMGLGTHLFCMAALRNMGLWAQSLCEANISFYKKQS